MEFFTCCRCAGTVSYVWWSWCCQQPQFSGVYRKPMQLLIYPPLHYNTASYDILQDPYSCCTVILVFWCSGAWVLLTTMMIKCGTCTAVLFLLLLMYYTKYTGCSTLAGGAVPLHGMYCVQAGCSACCPFATPSILLFLLTSHFDDTVWNLYCCAFAFIVNVLHSTAYTGCSTLAGGAVPLHYMYRVRTGWCCSYCCFATPSLLLLLILYMPTITLFSSLCCTFLIRRHATSGVVFIVCFVWTSNYFFLLCMLWLSVLGNLSFRIQYLVTCERFSFIWVNRTRLI